eukprot:TRINITY_DN2154_c1_g1_i1.p1 TRINITY_DN2154_c1_g1~~TRINITY_DN2154_c1_g1_i1.p1  ORF type:complete len:295 (+),score=26.25 TRINITY_DN2154_c1_g1_i1:419-1303(+)
MKVEWENLKVPNFIFLSSLAVFVENLLYHPFWVLKTQDIINKGSSSGTSFSGLKKQIVNLAKTQGITGFYRAYWLSSAATLPWLYLLTYNYTKYKLSNDKYPTWVQNASPLIAGIAGDIICVPFWVPLDVVIQNRMHKSNLNRSSYAVAKDLFMGSGLKSFYKGSVMTFFYYGLNSGIWWLSYEHTKSVLYKTAKLDELTDKFRVVPITAAMIGAFLSVVITSPIDVVKIRMQTAIGDERELYRNARVGFRSVMKADGLHGFFRGALPKFISRGPLSSVWAVVYELVIKYSSIN